MLIVRAFLCLRNRTEQHFHWPTIIKAEQRVLNPKNTSNNSRYCLNLLWHSKFRSGKVKTATLMRGPEGALPPCSIPLHCLVPLSAVE